jgi:hypothetical protein
VPQASPWIALEAGADADASARALSHVHERFFGSAEPPSGGAGPLRSVISASWRRCARAGVTPADHDVAVLDDGELRERRAASGLEAAVAALRELLDGTGHLMIVTDAEGHLLWVEGDRRARAQGADVALVPGALWREDAAGTNAMGTSLAVAHPVQVFAAEHVRSAVHGWTCSAAPLRRRDTGSVVGCVDLTGPARTVHPHSLTLVTAAARAVELLLPNGFEQVAAAVRLRALGTDRLTLEVGARRVELSPRHSEIAVLLALNVDGLTADELARELFGEDGKPVSVRAELSRMRRMLGPVLDAQPYRLTVPLLADFDEVRDHVAAGRAAAALEAYPGPLLPASAAPGIVEFRRGLDAAVRLAVIRSGDDDLLRRWVESPAGRHDLPALELLLRRRPRDPSLAPLGRHAARLRTQG